MARIDSETVQRILDTADIVEVVSDYVSLKRRGANYIGLCPFHNERTPSFSVSKSKGICKCFSCGKGGSPVNFIMEIEQMSYQEALKHLAKKYNIEIHERELTDKERQEASDRESLFAVNEMALKHFEHNLTDTDDGRDIGLTYFRERGINDWAIKRFSLGYSLPSSNDLYNTARAKGFNERFLIESGLCIKNERGDIYDRFKGRVMYPIFTISGKVVGFGGRTLRSDKNVAKYVNSPESAIYRKSYELYGLYQAKQAISKIDRCILVEGYMDVISMHQSGIENVVASSGTSLTEGQIKLIHRFTSNITVIYDSDPAGIKASLRGIDMILAEGMSVKVVLLPEGDDPDSFSQSHTTEEIQTYLDQHATDFISFKTDILLRGVEHDPVARAKVITDIVQSISVIPDLITRTVYIRECSLKLGISEKVLTLQVEKFYRNRLDNEALRDAKARAQATLNIQEREQNTPEITSEPAERTDTPTLDQDAEFLSRYERAVLRYIIKYGLMEIDDAELWEGSDEDSPRLLIDYVESQFQYEGLSFTNPIFAKVYQDALELRNSSWPSDYAKAAEAFDKEAEEEFDKGVIRIRETAKDLTEINAAERSLRSKVDNRRTENLRQFAMHYIEKRFASSPDDHLRQITTDLVSERYQLSKVHTKYTKVETEEDRLGLLIERAIYELEDAHIECRIRDVRRRLAHALSSSDRDENHILALMQESKDLTVLRQDFSKFLGERIIAPRK